MTKSELESFISTLEESGIVEYSIRCEGGNRVISNNDRSGVIKLDSDAIYAFEVDDNSYGKQGPFVIRKIAYSDDISSIQCRGLTTDQALKIVEALGINSDEVIDIISKHGDNVKNVPSLAGFGEVKDHEGKPVLNGMAGRITTGKSK